MVTEDKILSCDWGTSSFRLKLVSTGNQMIIGEIGSAEGVAHVHSQWENQPASGFLNKQDFYLRHLADSIQQLSAKVGLVLDQLPVVISGMASSSIGMKELPYATLPFALDGSNAIVHWLSGTQRNILLVSGARNEQDVMRGEETQLIGLSGHSQFTGTNRSTVYIFPGTHSKHVEVDLGRIIDLKTYMTGEVFDLMANQSVLRFTLQKGDMAHSFDEDALKAFINGVERAVSSPNILHTLFSVRVNQLFSTTTSKQANYFYLSGLLIGTELANLLIKRTANVVLCSASNIYRFYALALEQLYRPSQVTYINPKDMDSAAIKGHIQLYSRYPAPNLK